MSYLSTVESRFTGLTALLRERYLSSVLHTVHMHGTETMRRLALSANRTDQRDNYIQTVTANADNARASSDLLADFGKPNKHKARKLNYRYDPDNPSANDVRGIDAVARLSLAEIKSKGGSAEGQVDLAEMVTKAFFHGIDSTGTFFMHSDKTASKGTVSGTPLQATTDFANGTALSGGETSCSFVVADFAIGNFRNGDVIDIYNGTTLVADAYMVRHVDYDQYVLTIEKTADSTVANVDSIANTHTIYRSGEKDQGFLTSFGEFFKETISSGDSWVGGEDRSQLENFYLQPMKLRRGATPEIPDESHFDQLGRAMGYAHPGTDAKPFTLFAGSALVRVFRNVVGDGVVVHAPTTNNGEHTVGNTSLRYIDPNLGTIEMVSDPNARNDRMILVDTADWELMRAGMDDVEVLTGGGAYGYFERMDGTNSARGGSKYFRMEGSVWMTPVIKRMDRCACIYNLSDQY